MLLVWDGRIPDHEVRGIIMVKDPLEHASRRRPWNRGFSTIALKEYEAMVIDSVKMLMNGLEQREGQVIDIARWMTYFA
jgi:cytochrome P450